MEQRFIMTAFGEDRPGIVADVTRILYDNGCNLEDTTMSLLADEFTLVLLFSSPRADLEEILLRECRRLERDKGISAFLRPLHRRKDPAVQGVAEQVLHVEGQDQAGIVYRISQHLADRGVNITDLKSTLHPSPESGTAIYVMDIYMQVPDELPPVQLEQGLSAVADELHVDISLS